MTYTSPNTSTEISFNFGDTGLVGTLGVTVYDGDTATIARTTSGINEIGSTGVYIATITAPSVAGSYVVVLDDTSVFVSEDLSVTETSLVSVVSGDFTYDVTTTLGKVRLQIGDTDEAEALFADAEIEVYLEQYGDDVLKTAIALCDVLAIRFAREYDFETDQQKFARSQRSAMYRALAAELRAGADSGLSVTRQTKVDGYSQDIDGRTTSRDSRTGHAQVGYFDPDRSF